MRTKDTIIIQALQLALESMNTPSMHRRVWVDIRGINGLVIVQYWRKFEGGKKADLHLRANYSESETAGTWQALAAGLDYIASEMRNEKED